MSLPLLQAQITTTDKSVTKAKSTQNNTHKVGPKISKGEIVLQQEKPLGWEVKNLLVCFSMCCSLCLANT